MPSDFGHLPNDLPVPADDGACDHVDGLGLPSVPLRVASHVPQTVDLATHRRRAVVFFFPRTGGPMWTPPDEWDSIPGARGCTPESLGFSTLNDGFDRAGWDVFGVSTQSPDEQLEATERLRLEVPLLSDSGLELAEAIRLPTFSVDGTRLIKRLTLVIDEGVVVRHFYPVFPPDSHAAEVLAALRPS